MKIRNRLLVYSLVTALGIGISCCSDNRENEVDNENIKTESQIKIKEKRMDYGK